MTAEIVQLRPAAAAKPKPCRQPKPPTQIHGVKIISRYEDAQECWAMVNAANAMAFYPRCFIRSIFCDSKSDHYIIVLRDLAGLKLTEQDLAHIAQDAVDALGARLTHSGLCVNAYDGRDRELGGHELCRAEGNCWEE